MSMQSWIRASTVNEVKEYSLIDCSQLMMKFLLLVVMKYFHETKELLKCIVISIQTLKNVSSFEYRLI
jgi:hypothetical protein